MTDCEGRFQILSIRMEASDIKMIRIYYKM